MRLYLVIAIPAQTNNPPSLSSVGASREPSQSCTACYFCTGLLFLLACLLETLQLSTMPIVVRTRQVTFSCSCAVQCTFILEVGPAQCSLVASGPDHWLRLGGSVGLCP